MPSLSLKLKASFWIGFNLCVLHALGVLCLMLYSCSLLGKIVLLSLILLHGIYCYFHYVCLLSYKRVHALELNTQGEWFLYRNAIPYKAQLLANSLITHYLIILNFKTHDFLNTNVVLMRDSLSREEWRKLRIYLTTHNSYSFHNDSSKRYFMNLYQC